MKTSVIKLQKRINELTTVAQLIEQLQKLPQDAYIGGHGHFGEYLNFYGVELTTAYVTASGSWRDDNRMNIQVVSLSFEDAGPTPD